MLVTRVRKALLPVAFCCAISIAGFAQNLPLDTAVHTGTLPNGFTYYIRHNTEPKNRVLMYLVNKIGSMQEDDDQLGLAHFMEHMSFNGTKHYPKNELVRYLQKSGVRFGADLNAFTSFTETVYQLPIPGDDTAIVRNGLQIMRDWAAEATLDTKQIDMERGVVLEEKRLHNGAMQRMQDQSLRMQVNNSRYANRLPIGTEAVLKSFTPATIRKFYKDWYRPNLQALIIVGDIDVAAMERQVKKLFSDLKNPANERQLQTWTIPLTGKNQFIALTDAEQPYTSIDVLLKHPGTELKTKTDYRNSIIKQLYNAALGSRLGELSVTPDAPFIQTMGGMQEFLGGLEVMGATVIPKPGKIKEAFTAVWTELVRLQQYGITATELERHKSALLEQLGTAQKEKDKTPSQNYVQEYVQYFLKGVASPGIDAEYALAKEFVESITLEELNAYAAKAVKDTDRDIVIMAPDKDKAALPGEASVTEWINTISHSTLARYQDQVNDKGLLTTLPEAGRVVKREYADSVGVIKLTLSNGLKVWLKHTDFRNEEIFFSAYSAGGTSLYPDALYLNAAHSASLMEDNGLGDFTSAELTKALTGKMVNIKPFISERSEGISGAATPKDLETALQLAYLYFTAPRKDSSLFHNAIGRSKAFLTTRGNDPMTAFSDTVNMVLGRNHYRRQPLSAQSMDSINLDKVYAIYKERFADAADFTFVFTGSLDTAVVIPLIERYLGALPAAGKKETAKDLGIYMPEGKISKTVFKGKDDKANVNLFYSGTYTYNSAGNMQLQALGALLQYRLIERIRELEGGAYSPGAFVNYSKLPRNEYTFGVNFVCAPGNVEKLIAAANDEINKLKKGKIATEDINKFIAEQTRAQELQLRQNRYWMFYLLEALENDEPLTGVFQQSQLLKTVTVQSLQQAAVKYFNDKNYIRLVLMPEP